MKSANSDHVPASRRGRPSKYTPRTVRLICDAIAEGVAYKHAAALADISEDTFYEWKRTIPKFSESIDRSVARGILERLRIIKEAAKEGDVRAAQWWLEHVFPEQYAKSRIDVAHQGKVEYQLAIPTALLEEIARARAEHDQSSRN